MLTGWGKMLWLDHIRQGSCETSLNATSHSKRLIARRPQPVHIIDLTASDDEDEPQRRASTSHSIQAFTTSLPQDLPPSNHGLLLPGTFNSTQHHSGEMAQGGIQMVLPLGGPGAQPQASILRGTNLSRASTGQSFPRTIITALDRHMSVEEHPSKRRKTSGGTGAQEIPASVPARLTKGSEFQSHQRRNSPITEAQPIVPSRPAAILPPARHSVRGLDNSQINQWEGGAQNELSLLSLSRSSDQKRKTSKGERLHADILRVTLNAMVQNQRIVLHHTSSMPNSPEPAETYDIIRKQVCVHVDSSVAHYRSSISKEGRRNLGARVGSVLSVWASSRSTCLGFHEFLKLTPTPHGCSPLSIKLTSIRSQKNWWKTIALRSIFK